MKCFAVIAAAALAVASVSAETCDLLKIAPVVRGPNGVACTDKSGFNFLQATKPDAAMLAKVCPVAECQAVLKQVTALGLGDCTVPLATPIQLETDLTKAFETGCKGLAGGAATTGGSGSGNPSNTVPSPAPVATSKAPAATSKAGSSSGTGGATVSKTPAPTPAPTSAASSVAVASGAAVLAVAASFL